MRPEVIRQLVGINQTFYEQFATPFHTSRLEPAEGFAQLIAFLPDCPVDLLDVGCGNGRLGYYWWQHGRVRSYWGVDANPTYQAMAHAPDWFSQLPSPPPADLFQFDTADMMTPGFLERYPTADLVACLSALHHIPTRARRAALLTEMAAKLRPAGYLLLGNWQFMSSPRQQRKLVDWSAVGLTEADVEPDDYLLSWSRGGHGFRYVGLIDAAQTAELAEEAGLQVVHQFRADGREKDLNLYTILQATPPPTLV